MKTIIALLLTTFSAFAGPLYLPATNGVGKAAQFIGNSNSMTDFRATNTHRSFEVWGGYPHYQMSIPYNDDSVSFGATVNAVEFLGDGHLLTNLNASSLAVGTVPTAQLGSGTANSSTFLRGDNTWAAPSSGGGGGGLNFTNIFAWPTNSGGNPYALTVVGGTFQVTNNAGTFNATPDAIWQTSINSTGWSIDRNGEFTNLSGITVTRDLVVTNNQATIGTLLITNDAKGTTLASASGAPTSVTVSNLQGSGVLFGTNGLTSFSRNKLAPFTITVGASPFSFTNTFSTNNIIMFIDGAGVSVSTAVNGTTIYAAMTGADVSVPLQPTEWITLTYTISAPAVKWKPF